MFPSMEEFEICVFSVSMAEEDLERCGMHYLNEICMVRNCVQ